MQIRHQILKMDVSVSSGVVMGSNGCNSVTNEALQNASDNLRSASEIDTDILAIVRDVFRAVEKDNGDGTQRGKDSLEASQKVLELSKKIEKIREDIYLLPGISTSKAEQMSKLRNLRKQLTMKKALISRYKGLNLKVNGLSAAAARTNQN